MVNRKIYTHLDFDGLISAFLMQQLRDDITDVVFTTPQQVKLGRQPITKHDIVLDLPEPSTNYFLWYDHHPHNRCKQNKISGCYDPLAPSCARVMFEKHKALLKKWEGLVITADKIDTANFTQEELLNPDSAGMISKALLTKNIVRDNKLKKELLTLLKTKSLEEISKHPSII